MSLNKLLYIKRRAAKQIISALAIAASVAVAMISPALAQTLRIEVNKASVLKLTQAPSTIIIGNPALADVTPQENNVLVLVGKASGRTNIIILDENGDTMHNYDIAVQEEQDGNLTVFKAGKQWTYSCAPYCERAINPNDDEQAFKLNFAQVLAKSGQMNAAAAEAAATIDSDIGGNFNGAPNVIASNGANGGFAGGSQAGFPANGQPFGQQQPRPVLQTFTVLPPN